MGFFIILGYGLGAFGILVFATILGLILGTFRAKDILELAVLFFWLIVFCTIGSELLWSMGFINFERPQAIIPVEQESSEPSETWKFLTTPVWDMKKKE